MTKPRVEGLPSIERLRELLCYYPETGIIKRMIRGIPVRKPLGSIARLGYLTLSVDNQKIFFHRVAWALHYGEWPVKTIDHVNCNTGDNRIANLRLATKSENSQNRGKTCHNTSGFKGVYLNKRSNRWFSVAVVDCKRTHLGTYDTPEEAAQAYQAFIRIKAGEFSRTE